MKMMQKVENLPVGKIIWSLFTLIIVFSVIRGISNYTDEQGGLSICSTETQEVSKPETNLGFVLIPGKPPQQIHNNGKQVHWKWYREGSEGIDVILVRFHLKKNNGSVEISGWHNLANLGHLNPSDFDVRPGEKIVLIEFGVPKEGSTRRVEYEFI